MISRRAYLFLSATLAISALTAQAAGEIPGRKPMRKAGEMIARPEKPNVTPRVYDRVTPDNSHILVSLSHQRAYLMVGDEIAIDTPISSGKATRQTPAGKFTVLEKDPDHRSNIYGAFCDSQRRIVREGVSSVIDSAPSGTHFIGAPMKWFMRLTEKGIGMHVGILPGYPASHGCVRLPEDIAKMIYDKVKIGTPIEITP
ncbi:MAG: hypothetical protein QOD99_2839 [Chthoniobacter sp.]|jgi:lipoprotein-anchoring transpeptidase ErfK/SrfK|nr:hypothetical protein [Chthoniobacter sp.]